MSSFSTYLIGFIVLIIGLAIAAILLGVERSPKIRRLDSGTKRGC